MTWLLPAVLDGLAFIAAWIVVGFAAACGAMLALAAVLWWRGR